MANEITFGYPTGKTLTYGAYQPSGTVRTAAGTSLTEVAGTGYYKADDGNISVNDIVVVKEGSNVVGWGEYQPEVNVSLIEGVDATDQINAACDTALSDINLDHLIQTSGTVTDDDYPTTTYFWTDLTKADDYFNDMIIVFTSGNLAGQARRISDFANTGGQITVDPPLTNAPDTDNLFVIISGSFLQTNVSQVKLASDGLDAVSVSEPSGDPVGWNFRQLFMWLIARFKNKHYKDSANNEINVYNSSDSKITKQSYTAVGGDETVNKIAQP